MRGAMVPKSRPAGGPPAGAGHRVPRGGTAASAPARGPPAGWLVGAGFPWLGDYAARALPYRHQTAAGPIVAIPFTMEVNDMPLYVRYGNAPDAFTGVLRRLLEHWPQRHNAPACLDVTVHAHVFGRPFGAIEFTSALDMVKPLDWAWVTTHRALAALYKS